MMGLVMIWRLGVNYMYTQHPEWVATDQTQTPTTAPSSADRTGTVVRPRPGSMAIRTPVVATGDNPARAVAATTVAAAPGLGSSERMLRGSGLRPYLARVQVPIAHRLAVQAELFCSRRGAVNISLPRQRPFG